MLSIIPTEDPGRQFSVAEPAHVDSELDDDLAVELDEAATVDALPLHGRHTRWSRTLSLTDMPECLHHAHCRQPDGWAEVGDLLPTMPLPAIIEQFADEARDLVPGREVVGIRDVRATRSLELSEPARVNFRATFDGWTEVHAAIPRYVEATLIMGSRHLTPPPVPVLALPSSNDGGSRRYTARTLYNSRILHRGPRYQSVTEVHELHRAGVRGTIIRLPAPGALLDGVSQLLELWLIEHETDATVLRHTSVRNIELFGPPPPVGSSVQATAQLAKRSGRLARADVELTVTGPDGQPQLWGRISGWHVQAMASDDRLSRMLRFPERELLCAAHPSGWVVADERCRNVATRQVLVRQYLNRDERELYETRDERAQRQWLLTRIAVKDAARRWLWDHDHGELHPIELDVYATPQASWLVTTPAGGRPLEVDVVEVEGGVLAHVRD